MDIRYTDPGFDYSIDSIFLFQTEDETPFWTDSLYYFYPQLDRARTAATHSSMVVGTATFAASSMAVL